MGHGFWVTPFLINVTFKGCLDGVFGRVLQAQSVTETKINLYPGQIS